MAPAHCQQPGGGHNLIRVHPPGPGSSSAARSGFNFNFSLQALTQQEAAASPRRPRAAEDQDGAAAAGRRNGPDPSESLGKSPVTVCSAWAADARHGVPRPGPGRAPAPTSGTDLAYGLGSGRPAQDVGERAGGSGPPRHAAGASHAAQPGGHRRRPGPLSGRSESIEVRQAQSTRPDSEFPDSDRSRRGRGKGGLPDAPSPG